MTTRLSLMLAASSLVLATPALAEEEGLSPEKVAAIQRDEAAAQAKVNEEFGNRKPSEMSNAERGESIRAQQKESAKVLEKHGVSAKEFATFTARMTPEDNQRAANEAKRLEDKAKAEKEAEAKKRKGDGEVHIQQGFSDADPVELESADGAEPSVDVDGSLDSSSTAGAPTVEIGNTAGTAKGMSKKASRRRR
ncbi:MULTISPECIES: hypothetical protein [unclassified Corallococcus]|uniref:hypothetical protein n=1 Tax=unclassified Corallococcus TaxID=2685029 RepID=UPI001A8FCC52|nr:MULTISPECIES: hypothetical protein [unclassified Corallococcus]MBN9686579.1 hypothetical protein [Corallococcus sp. NCSPR001]WAS81998.1 hypothetical protein O0N60_22010 [Corallococcus sp. NCRR]